VNVKPTGLKKILILELSGTLLNIILLVITVIWSYLYKLCEI